MVYIVVIIGIALTIFSNITALPAYKLFFKRSFYEDDMAQYTLELLKNNTLLHMKGSMGYGLSKDVKKLISENPGIKGIVLDTTGGRAYEGRQLAKLISHYDLDTYSLACCASAGTMPFLAGKKRYLTNECILVFHRAKMEVEYLDRKFDAGHIQRKDYELYPSQEIDRVFFEKVISELVNNEYWIPTMQELLDAHVIDGIVEVRDIIFDFSKLDKDLYKLLSDVAKLEANYGIDDGAIDLKFTENKISKGLTLDERDKIYEQLKVRIERLNAVKHKNSTELQKESAE